MAQGVSGAAGFSDGLFDPSVRVYVRALVTAAGAVSTGGVVAIIAVVNGASSAASVGLLTAFVVAGAVAAIVMVRRGRRRLQPASAPGRSVSDAAPKGRRATRLDRRALRRDRRAIRRSEVFSPAVLLEEQLTERYGVPVERIAGHVWRIDGELVEATLDPMSGQLMTGGRELQL